MCVLRRFELVALKVMPNQRKTTAKRKSGKTRVAPAVTQQTERNTTAEIAVFSHANVRSWDSVNVPEFSASEPPGGPFAFPRVSRLAQSQ